MHTCSLPGRIELLGGSSSMNTPPIPPSTNGRSVKPTATLVAILRPEPSATNYLCFNHCDTAPTTTGVSKSPWSAMITPSTYSTFLPTSPHYRLKTSNLLLLQKATPKHTRQKLLARFLHSLVEIIAFLTKDIIMLHIDLNQQALEVSYPMPVSSISASGFVGKSSFIILHWLCETC